jgi:hypothetical protein
MSCGAAVLVSSGGFDATTRFEQVQKHLALSIDRTNTSVPEFSIEILRSARFRADMSLHNDTVPPMSPSCECVVSIFRIVKHLSPFHLINQSISPGNQYSLRNQVCGVKNDVSSVQS